MRTLKRTANGHATADVIRAERDAFKEAEVAWSGYLNLSSVRQIGRNGSLREIENFVVFVPLVGGNIVLLASEQI